MRLSELKRAAATRPEPSAEEMAATVRRFLDAMGRPSVEFLREQLERPGRVLAQALRYRGER